MYTFLKRSLSGIEDWLHTHNWFGFATWVFGYAVAFGIAAIIGWISMPEGSHPAWNAGGCVEGFTVFVLLGFYLRQRGKV